MIGESEVEVGSWVVGEEDCDLAVRCCDGCFRPSCSLYEVVGEVSDGDDCDCCD